MIKINLKPGTKRARAAAGGPGAFAGLIEQLKALPGAVKDPWPLAAVLTLVLVGAFLLWVGVGSSVRVSQLEPELDQARSENRRHRQFLAQKRKAEAVRDSIVNQIATIRTVDGDRYVWPHILDEVTRALPPFTWLVSFTHTTPTAAAVPDPAATADSVAPPPPPAVQVVGRTMDIGGLTRFMRQLEDSPFLEDVQVLSAETVVDHNRAVTSFTVKATFTRPGQQHLRTMNLTTGG